MEETVQTSMKVKEEEMCDPGVSEVSRSLKELLIKSLDNLGDMSENARINKKRRK